MDQLSQFSTPPNADSVKRKLDFGEEPSKKPRVDTKNVNNANTDEDERPATDGSAPGGSTFSLMSTISTQNIWAPFKLVNRKTVQLRDLTDYLNFGFTTGSARSLYLDPSVNSQTLSGNLGGILNIKRYTKNTLRLSNLIITNDSLNIQSGTPVAATTFNSSPYLAIFRDKTNLVSTIVGASQFNAGNSTTAASWALLDLQNRHTFTDLNNSLTQGMDCQFWKMGDDAVTIDYHPINMDCFQTNNQLMPFGTYDHFNFTRGVTNTPTTFPFVSNNNFPAYITLPHVPDAQGSSIKFGASFILEQDIEGFVLVSSNGNLIERNVITTETFLEGERPTFSGDVRTSNTGTFNVVST